MSTCSGDCFVLQQSSQEIVMRDVLHSVDSGNHTCSVVDDVGNTGSTTVEVLVSGMYMNASIVCMYQDFYGLFCLVPLTHTCIYS